VALLVLGAPAARADGPVNIRIAWMTPIGQLAAVLFQKPDIMRYYGKSYTVDPIYYKGSGPQITALAAGELEIAEYAPDALALTIASEASGKVRTLFTMKDAIGESDLSLIADAAKRAR
jgi:NitT/TauT family transport system substrate-binding protein